MPYHICRTSIHRSIYIYSQDGVSALAFDDAEQYLPPAQSALGYVAFSADCDTGHVTFAQASI